MDTLPPDERYSYVFEGNSQSLDHIVVSNGLRPCRSKFDVVHVNAEFADQASDHDPSVARFALPNAAPTIDDVSTVSPVACAAVSSVTFTTSDPSIGDTVDAVVTWGDGTTTELADVEGTVTAEHTYALAGTYTVTIDVTDGTSSDSETVELVVNYTVVGGGLQSPRPGATAKYGSTTPVRVVLEDCDGSRPGDLAPTLAVTREGYRLDAGTMRFDAGQYILPFKTSRLPGRGTYTYVVTVPGTGQEITRSIRLT